MDYLTINSEIRENNRVLQNLKDAMKQRNLARMIDAKKKLNERYGFYDTLSNNWSLRHIGKRDARVDEYNRLTGEYNVLKPSYLRLKATLEAEKRRNDQRFSLLQLLGEDLPTYYLRLTTPTHRGGVGFKNLDRALLAVAAEELESNKHAPPPNPNKWKCSACHHMNPKTDKKCTMCEEPKPNKFQMLKKSLSTISFVCQSINTLILRFNDKSSHCPCVICWAIYWSTFYLITSRCNMRCIEGSFSSSNLASRCQRQSMHRIHSSFRCHGGVQAARGLAARDDETPFVGCILLVRLLSDG